MPETPAERLRKERIAHEQRLAEAWRREQEERKRQFPGGRPERMDLPSGDASDEDRSGLSNFARGAALGGAESLTSLGEVAGLVPGLGGVGRGSEAVRQRLEERLDPEGFAGKAGRFVGRAAGEMGQAMVGAPLIAKGLGVVAPRAAKALQAGMSSGSRLTRAGAVAAANAPIDVLQGAKADEGIVLPGRLGSIFENVAFSGAAGALLPAARGARQVEPEAPPRDTGFPERTTPLPAEGINPDDYANITRMTADTPEMAEGVREAVADAVATRQIPLREPATGKQKLGRLVEAETRDEVLRRTADLYGVDPSDIVARTAKGERVERETIIRAVQEYGEVQERINALTTQLNSRLLRDPAEIARLEAVREVERGTRRDVLASIIVQKTEKGRDLAAMRFAAILTRSPENWQSQLEELAKRTLTGDEIAQVTKLAEAGDVQGLTRMANEVRKASTAEKLITAYKASLLSSPKTHIINFTGNEGMFALRQVRDIPATFADMALASLTGRRSKVLNVPGRIAAIRRGTVQGLEDARAVLRGEAPVSNKFLEARETNYDNAFANLYTKGIFRALDASDRLFKGQAFAESIDEQLRVIAKNNGLKGEAAEAFVERMTKAPPSDVSAEAILAAERATFQQTTELSRTAVHLRDKLGPLGHLLFPFAKTPANIAGTIVNYTPLGLAGPEFRRNARKVLSGLATTREQRMVAERIGEFSTGTAVLFAGYLLAKKDRMTGFFPSDDRTRAQWETEGRMEGSVKVGNEWVQIARLSPLGNLLTIGAALADVEKGNPDLLSMAIGSVAAPLSAVTDLPMVQGVSNVAEALSPSASAEQRKAAALRLGGGVAAGAIPFSGLLRSVAQATDPMKRETRSGSRLGTMGRQVVAGLPGVSRTLPAKVDPLGAEIRRGGTALERFASPFQRQTDLTSTDPLRAALHEADAVVGRVAPRKGETPEAYQERAMRTGEIVRKIVERGVSHPSLRAIDTMNVERVQRQLEETGVDTAGKTPDELRAALRTQMLERVIARGKSIAARQFRQPVPARARALERILQRQP